MKFMSIFFLFILFHQATDSFLLTKDHVGGLRVGAAVDTIYAVYGRKNTSLVDRYIEATWSPAVEVRRGDELLFVADIDGDTIYSFEIFSARFRTKSGIRVGSEFKDIVENQTVTSIEVEGEGIFVVVDDLNMSFRLLMSDLAAKGINIELGEAIDVSEMPEEVRIESIILY